MLRTALRDVRWRMPQIAPAALAAALLIGGATMLAGWSAALHREADRAVEVQGAQFWIAPANAAGPFSAGAGLSPTQLASVRALPDVLRADPVLAVRSTVDVGDSTRDALVLGIESEGLGGLSKVTSGTNAVTAGQAVVSASFGAAMGDTVQVAGEAFTVVGIAADATVFGGAGMIAIPIEQARGILTPGSDALSMIVIRGEAPGLDDSMRAFDAGATRDDLLRSVDERLRSTRVLGALLWIGAGLLLAGVGWRLAGERAADIALSRSFGLPGWRLLASFVVQCLIFAVGAAAVGLVIGAAVGAVAPVPYRANPRNVIIALLASLPIAALATAAGLRSLFRLRPSLPFALGRSTVDGSVALASGGTS
jgi:hypothetical protein